WSLRAASDARPREVMLYHMLGLFLTEQTPPRWAEAVECYRAARALRPELGINLAEALRHGGRAREGANLLARMVKERLDDPFLFVLHGVALYHQGDLDGAIACYEKAIKLYPSYDGAYFNLGLALFGKGDLSGVIASYKKGIEFNPKHAPAHNNLGSALK